MHIMFAIMFNTSRKVLQRLDWTVARFLLEAGKVKNEAFQHLYTHTVTSAYFITVAKPSTNGLV